MDENVKKIIKKAADLIIQVLFDTTGHLEEEGIYISAGEDNLSQARNLISEALEGYPESQVDLVLECLLAAGNMDTREEAESYMKEE